jgi:hypothetical protein
VPGDAAPWTRTDLSGTGTTQTFACGVLHACVFRIGYVDASGHIGGVTNSVIASGQDAPVLTAVPGIVAGSVDLSWTQPTSGGLILNYEIDRDTGSGFTFLKTVGASPLSYEDTTCGPGATCSYRIRAFYTVGESPQSNVATATAPNDTPLTITTPTAATRVPDSTPTLAGTAGSVGGDSTTITVKVFVGATTGGAMAESVNATRNGTTWSVDATSLGDGTYTAQAQQTNYLSTLVMSAPVTFIVDTTPPAVSITSVNGTARTLPYSTNTPVTTIGGTCGTATGDNATVSVTIGGAGLETGTAPCTAGAWTYTLTTPFTTDGAYTATATQTDTAGNTGTSGAKTITIDTAPPVVTMTTINGTVRTLPFSTNGTVTSVGGACSTGPGDAGTVSVAITGASTQNGTVACVSGAWSFTPASALASDGIYTITATQGDTAGNTGTSGPQTITIDKTPPAVTLTTVNGTAQTFPLLTNATVTTVGGTCGTATGDSPNVSIATTGAGSENGTAACVAGAWTYSYVSALTVNGAYSVTATQTDSVSNTGTSGAKAITVDTTAPIVTLTNVNGTIRAFPFTTNQTVTTVGGGCGSATGDSATVSVAITGASTQNGSASCTAGAWTFTPATPLSASGTYAIAATQTDAAGNSGTTGAQTIVINTQAPTVTVTTVNGVAQTFPLTTNATITTVGGSCTTAAGVNQTVSVAITGAGAQTGSSACSSGAWTFSLNNALNADGVSAVTATQTDTAGNTGTSGAQAITVDKTPPVVAVTAVNGSTRTFPYTLNATVTSDGGT